MYVVPVTYAQSTTSDNATIPMLSPHPVTHTPVLTQPTPVDNQMFTSTQLWSNPSTLIGTPLPEVTMSSFTHVITPAPVCLTPTAWVPHPQPHPAIPPVRLLEFESFGWRQTTMCGHTFGYKKFSSSQWRLAASCNHASHLVTRNLAAVDAADGFQCVLSHCIVSLDNSQPLWPRRTTHIMGRHTVSDDSETPLVSMDYLFSVRKVQ